MDFVHSQFPETGLSGLPGAHAQCHAEEEPAVGHVSVT